MIDFLKSIDFGVFKSCQCNGGEASFKHNTPGKMVGVVIRTFRRGDHYKILKGGSVINKGLGYQLETEYNKLFA